MYTTKIGLEPAIHDSYIKSEPLSHLLQSSKWHQIKDNWNSELIGFFDDDKLVASVSVLIRPLPLGYTMLYIPRGIAMDYSDEQLLAYVFSELKKYGKTQKAVFIKFDPAIENKPENDNIIKKLKKLGAKWMGLTAEMHDTIQPRFNAVVYKDDFAEEKFNKKTKQALRKARNSHTIVKFGRDELLDDFAKMIAKTESRKGISLRNRDYFEKLVDTYEEDANITIVYLDLQALLADAQEAFAKAKQALASKETTNEKKIKQLEAAIAKAAKDVTELTDLILINGDVIPVSSALTVNFGVHTEHLYAGTDTTYQKYYTAYLAWFESIQYMFDRGAETVNMGGLENSLLETNGLLKFKKNFNPKIEEYVGEFDIAVNPLMYPIVNKLYMMRKKHV
ncbi:peptidoglycan bridge formation glycyltransferase FemA/FemB family protein [Lactococcus sp.]|uniref:peptidoglycan bridge formation glycyltransferase FemA/FemB family protein n=1 Tax=Lactococcus sp. TaxID=44273 RepID=UPI0035B1B68C